MNINVVLFQARIIYDEHLFGCLVKSVDHDDHDNKCQCQKYPVLAVIKAGMEGKPKPDINKCTTWAVTKRG